MGQKYELVLENFSHEDFPDSSAGTYKVDEKYLKRDPALLASAVYGILKETKFGKLRLYRIKMKETGTMGGWVESTANLSQSGACWIHPNAIVCGNALVSGDAQIRDGQVGDNAFVGGSAEVSGTSVIGGKCSVYGKVKDSIITVAPTPPIESGSGGSAGGDSGEASKEVKPTGLLDFEAADYTGDYVTILETGIVENKSVILGNARIAGTVDNSVVGGESAIYGKVSGKSMVLGNSVVMEGAEVKDGFLLLDGMVKGSVTKGS